MDKKMTGQTAGESPIQQEIMDKLKHANVSPRSANESDVNNYQLLAAQYVTDHRTRLLADATALQAATLQCNYANHLPVPLMVNQNFRDNNGSGEVLINQRPHMDCYSVGSLSHERSQGSSFSSDASSHSTPTSATDEAEIIKGESAPSSQEASQWTYEEQFKQVS